VPALAARVVDTSPSNFEQTVVIDRGDAVGVRKGMPVVTGAGLVGRVVSVSKKRAVVLLLTDRSFNLGVRLSSSGDTGAARGNGPDEPLNVDLVYNSTVVHRDEVVVTSGQAGAIFPCCIPVGRVRTARAVPSALQQEITIVPVVDLQRLEFVKVLLWTV
jgi:rod shape-determining protein MreC